MGVCNREKLCRRGLGSRSPSLHGSRGAIGRHQSQRSPRVEFLPLALFNDRLASRRSTGVLRPTVEATFRDDVAAIVRTISPEIRVHPTFWGDSSGAGEVVGFHPEGISEISRGLSVRDTPGRESSKWDLHPEGMLAGSRRQPEETVLASLQDANPVVGTLPGVSRTLNPRLMAEILSGSRRNRQRRLSKTGAPKKLG